MMRDAQFPSFEEFAFEAERRDLSRATVAIRADMRRVGRTPFAIVIRDLSPTGCRGETLSRVVEGDRIWITLPGFAALEGRIRWATKAAFGAQWHTKLHPSVFDHISARHPGLVRP